MTDLRERFAKIALFASKPIVPYRETAVHWQGRSYVHISISVDVRPDLSMARPQSCSTRPRGTVQAFSIDNLIMVVIRAVPLPAEMLDFMESVFSSKGKAATEANDGLIDQLCGVWEIYGNMSHQAKDLLNFPQTILAVCHNNGFNMLLDGRGRMQR